MRQKSTHFEKIALLMLMLLAGLLGGVIRLMHLRDGFDTLGLAISGNRSGLILLILCVFMLVALGVVILLAASDRLFPQNPVSIGIVGIPTILFAIFAAIAATCGTIVSFASAIRSVSVWGMLSSLLFFATAALTVPVVRRLSMPVDGVSPTASASLVPVFWACFRLIEVYRTVSANPSVSAYFYDIAALITMILMLFACSGYLYGRKSATRVYLSVAANLFFCTLSLVGRGGHVLRLLLSSTTVSDSELLDVLIFLYGFLYTLAVVPLFFAPHRRDPMAALNETDA